MCAPPSAGRTGLPRSSRSRSFPAPTPGRGQVRVRVAAAAVNFPDVLLVANEYQVTVPTPFVPGSEFAGVVEEVADGVDDVAVGDRVAGTGLVGAFAEEVVVAGGVAHAHPDRRRRRDAAAFGVAHRTAYHVLRSVARLQPGDELVVLGAGGGVGLAAVQLGALLGASVTAVASSREKLDVAASLRRAPPRRPRAATCGQALREVPSGRRRRRRRSGRWRVWPSRRCARCAAAAAS